LSSLDLKKRLTGALDGGTDFSTTPVFAAEVDISASAFFSGAAALSAFAAGLATVSTTLGIYMFTQERIIYAY
jgi:hypothetical protein